MRRRRPRQTLRQRRHFQPSRRRARSRRLEFCTRIDHCYQLGHCYRARCDSRESCIVAPGGFAWTARVSCHCVESHAFAASWVLRNVPAGLQVLLRTAGCTKYLLPCDLVDRVVNLYTKVHEDRALAVLLASLKELAARQMLMEAVGQAPCAQSWQGVARALAISCAGRWRVPGCRGTPRR